MKHYLKKSLLFIIIFSLSIISLQISANDTVYSPKMKFDIYIKAWGLTAYGDMEIIGKTHIDGREVLLIRSRSIDVAGILGFVAKFLRVYKHSNTFDTYIDLETLLPVRYEVYKLEKNGSKKMTEHVLFDRKLNRIISYDDKSTILNNVPSNIYDTFSGFLGLIHRFNKEDIFIGRRYDFDIYMYREVGHISAIVTGQKVIDGKKTYVIEINKLPDIFKYPASVKFEIANYNEKLILPTKGECIIDIPVFSDVTLKGELHKIK
jgi:hypothetical protein